MILHARLERGNFIAECEEHNNYRVPFHISDVEIESSLLTQDEMLEAAATEALRLYCPGCVLKQRKLPETRWPEGAEL